LDLESSADEDSLVEESGVDELAVVVESPVPVVVLLLLASVAVDVVVVVVPPNSSTPPPMVPPGRVLVGVVDVVVVEVGERTTVDTVVPPPPSLVFESVELVPVESPLDWVLVSLAVDGPVWPLVSVVVCVAELSEVLRFVGCGTGSTALTTVTAESRLVFVLAATAWVTDDVVPIDVLTRLGASSAGVLPVKFSVL